MPAIAGVILVGVIIGAVLIITAGEEIRMAMVMAGEETTAAMVGEEIHMAGATIIIR
jgi:uncharacterized protein YqfA (UPF0365 family)